jgi:hypothetical protein
MNRHPLPHQHAPGHLPKTPSTGTWDESRTYWFHVSEGQKLLDPAVRKRYAGAGLFRSVDLSADVCETAGIQQWGIVVDNYTHQHRRRHRVDQYAQHRG